MVFPTVLGGGKRLFGETAATEPLRLTESRPDRRDLDPDLRARPEERLTRGRGLDPRAVGMPSA